MFVTGSVAVQGVGQARKAALFLVVMNLKPGVCDAINAERKHSAPVEFDPRGLAHFVGGFNDASPTVLPPSAASGCAMTSCGGHYYTRVLLAR